MSAIILRTDNICRICMNGKNSERKDYKLENVLRAGKNNSSLIDEVKAYYEVQMTGNDTNTSNLICEDCVSPINEWLARKEIVAKSNLVFNFITKQTQIRLDINDLETATNESHQLMITNNLEENRMDDNIGLLAPTETSLLPITNNHLRILQPDNSLEQTTRNDHLTCCPFCNYHVVENKPSNLEYKCCKRHGQPHTCLVHNCNWVFPNLSLFIKHYRKHLALDSRTFLCGKCLDIKKRSKTSKVKHIHQKTSKHFCCCGRHFPTMLSFVMHKLNKHSPNVAMHLKVNVPNNATDISCENKKIKLFTCTVTDCNKVYDYEAHNIAHYRQHAFIPNDDFICSKCLKSGKDTSLSFSCTHDKLIGCVECNTYFNNLHDYAKHKLCLHGAIVIRSVEKSFGCPVCLENFDNYQVKITDHYIKCFSRSHTNGTLYSHDETNILPKTTNLSESNNVIPSVINKKFLGSAICQVCDRYLNSLGDYIEHTAKEHKNIISLKEEGIQLCPLCDNNYYIPDFIRHINDCTNSMKLSSKPDEYGCIYCKTILKNYTPYEFRKHFNFCRSFKTIFDNVNMNKYYNCKFCGYTNEVFSECVIHANAQCIYFQLRIKYAAKANEKKSVEERKILEECDNIIDSEMINPECDKTRRKKLKSYNYFCNICTKGFFNEDIFLNHLNSNAERCRPKNLRYCKLCLTDFTDDAVYNEHTKIYLPSVPNALTIKDEIMNDGDEYGVNNLMDDQMDPEFDSKDNKDFILTVKDEKLDDPIDDSIDMLSSQN